jgi:hypothetical protein
MEKPSDKKSNIGVEDARLYAVSIGLSQDDRKLLGLRFPVKTFVQDPLVAKKHEKKGILGLEQIFLDWEPGIMDGPTSARVAVVDYNADTGILAKPVAWKAETKEFDRADNPESFQFHQVNVWAIVQNTLAFFEDPYVMGRPIPWGFDGNRLVVLPHAGIMKNAFYNRRGKCLQFYYFTSDGNPVYTCLSHDIVAHETGHAILDGIRPYYYETSSVQTAAFHEFIADLTAILSALRNGSVREAVAKISKGDIWKTDVISDLGEEFAEKEVKKTYGDSQRYYLRTARNEKTMKKIEDHLEPHDCSEVLTGAMFKVLARITELHIDKYGMSPKEALWKATRHLNRLAFRALDYCPPVDIQFIDYAQAVIRADKLAYPVDTFEYMKIVQEVFKSRGLTELDPPPPPNSVELTWKYGINSIASSRTAAYHFLNDNRGHLDIPLNQDFEVVDLYYTDKVVGANKRLPREIILEYVWKEDVALEGERFGQFSGRVFSLLCGGTLVFDERGNILYWSKKGGTQTGEEEKVGEQRKEQLLKYIEKLINAGMIELTNAEAFSSISIYQAPIMAIQEGNVLHLAMTPQLLHLSKECAE